MLFRSPAVLGEEDLAEVVTYDRRDAVRLSLRVQQREAIPRFPVPPRMAIVALTLLVVPDIADGTDGCNGCLCSSVICDGLHYVLGHGLFIRIQVFSPG